MARRPLLLILPWLLSALSAQEQSPKVIDPIEFGKAHARDSAEKLTAPYRTNVGVVFTERGYVPVEDVLWLSDEMIRRWLGRLSTRERWSEGELERRLAMLADAMNGQSWFLVSLRAYPKQDVFELGNSEPARTENLALLEAYMSINDVRMRGEILALGRWRARSAAELSQYKWWLHAPFGGPMAPADELEEVKSPYDFGDYHAAWYLIHFPIKNLTRPFQLRFESPTKTRTAGY